MRLINLYRETVGGRRVLKGVLGTQAFATVEGHFCRAAGTVNGVLYVVQGGALYSIDADGNETLRGAVEDSPETTISGNNGLVTICAGGKYYTYDPVSGALVQPVTGAFDAFGSVGFMGQYTVLTEKAGRRVQWSVPASAGALDGLDYATTEAADDLNIRGMPVGAEYWIFKDRSIERWYLTGEGFAAIPGATIMRGLKSFRLVTEIPNGAFFVGADGKAYIAMGGAIQPVSTVGVETDIARGDLRAVLYYRDEGHEMCCIIFGDRPAACYDVATNEWHNRASGDAGPWAADALAYAYGKWVVCDATGGVHELARTSADVGQVLVRRAASTSLFKNGRRFTVPRITFPAKVGRYGATNDAPVVDVLAQDDPEDADAVEVAADALLEIDQVEDDATPKIDLRVSGDHGETWGPWKPLSLGGTGQYTRRVTKRRLGQFRQFAVELRLTVPHDVTLGAAVEVDLG